MSTIDQSTAQINSGILLPITTATTISPVTEDATDTETDVVQSDLTQAGMSDDAVSNVESADTSDVAQVETSVWQESRATISNRALNLQKLADEFFPGGPKTLTITPDFVQRLNDYQLISDEQLNSLPDSIKSQDDENQDSISTLISNTETIMDKIESDPELSGLFEILKASVEQMEQFQVGGSSSFTKSSKLLANEITAQVDLLSKNDFTDSETETLNQMVIALNLTDSLYNQNTNAASNSVINNYLG